MSLVSDLRAFVSSWLSWLRPSDPQLAHMLETALYTASVLLGLAALFRILRAVAARGSSANSSGGSRHHPFLRLPSRPDNPGHHWVSLGARTVLPSAAPVASANRCLVCHAVLVSSPSSCPDANANPPPASLAGSGSPGGACGSVICTDCGILACERSKCLKSAERKHACKAVASLCKRSRQEKEEEELPRHRHHWVAATTPGECEVCEGADASCCTTDADDEDEAEGDHSEHEEEEEEGELRCCWCHRLVHRGCRRRMGDHCDFGEFRRFVIPPGCVQAQQEDEDLVGKVVRLYPRSRRRWLISGVCSPPVSLMAEHQWSPLIVIGNTRAGNNDGGLYLNAFRSLLNPAQVVDLDQLKVEDGLHWCEMMPEGVRCVVLIAGGDGTIGWVLNTIDSLNLKTRPLICLLPLGTGNDLGRTLGYGSGGGVADVRRFLQRVLGRMDEVALDRWRVDVASLAAADRKRKTFRRAGGGRKGQKTVFMQNYFSLGVDALVTYNFHRAREDKMLPFSGRMINKFLFFIYGTKDVLERECKDLDQIIELTVDGKKIDLPNIESVVVLNIPCWGAGVRPWELGSEHVNFSKPRINDERLEVFCVYSSFHIAQMQVGLSEPHRIGQAKEVQIRLKGKAPVQADGEPWIQGPSDITITHHNQVRVLKLLQE